MANQKLTHTIEWEQIGGNYRIIKLTGSKRQPTLDEAREYLREHHLPEEIWCCGFYNNQEASDGYFDEYEINKTLTLYEYAKYNHGKLSVVRTDKQSFLHDGWQTSSEVFGCGRFLG